MLSVVNDWMAYSLSIDFDSFDIIEIRVNSSQKDECILREIWKNKFLKNKF